MYSKLAREEEEILSNWCECSEQCWVTGSRLIKQSCLCLATNRAECFSLWGIVSLFYREDQTDRDSFGCFSEGKEGDESTVGNWNWLRVVCGVLGVFKGLWPIPLWHGSMLLKNQMRKLGQLWKGILTFSSKLGLGYLHNLQGVLNCPGSDSGDRSGTISKKSP